MKLVTIFDTICFGMSIHFNFLVFEELGKIENNEPGVDDEPVEKAQVSEDDDGQQEVEHCGLYGVHVQGGGRGVKENIFWFSSIRNSNNLVDILGVS